MNVVQVFLSSLNSVEHGWFCFVFVGLVSVEDFVESCFWLLVVLIPILFVFSAVIRIEYILEM